MRIQKRLIHYDTVTPTRPKLPPEGKPSLLRQAIARRPSRLDDDLASKFCELIKRGMPFDGICDFLGVNSSLFYEWIRKGEAFLNSGDEAIQEHEIYGGFVALIRQASAEYRLTLINSVHREGNRNWFRDVCLLERRDRKNFSRSEPTGGDDADYSPDEKFI